MARTSRGSQLPGEQDETPAARELGVSPARRAGSGDLAKHGAGHQPGAAGIVEVEDAANKLARGVEAGDRVHVAVDHLAAIRIDAHAAEGERQPAADLIALE